MSRFGWRWRRCRRLKYKKRIDSHELICYKGKLLFITMREVAMEKKTPAELVASMSNLILYDLYTFAAPAIGMADCFTPEEKRLIAELSHCESSSDAMKRFREEISAELWVGIMSFLLHDERRLAENALASVMPYYGWLLSFCRQKYSDGALARLRDKVITDRLRENEDDLAEMDALIRDPVQLGRRIFHEKITNWVMKRCFDGLLAIGRQSRAISVTELATLAEACCLPDCDLIKTRVSAEFTLPLLAYLVYGRRVDYARAALFLRHDCVKLKRAFHIEQRQDERVALRELRQRTTLTGRSVKCRRLPEARVTRRAWNDFLGKADLAAFMRFSAREVFADAFVNSRVSFADVDQEEWFADSSSAGVRFHLARGRAGRLEITKVVCLLPPDRRRLERLSKK